MQKYATKITKLRKQRNQWRSRAYQLKEAYKLLQQRLGSHGEIFGSTTGDAFLVCLWPAWSTSCSYSAGVPIPLERYQP
jgi:hypothetical protein